MSNIIETVNSLPDLLQLKSATITEITDAEFQLKISFADEYKEYLLAFGAILADGIELTGIAKSDYRNVIFVTKREWALNTNVPHSLYVIENIGVDGIIIWQDASGYIYKSTPNSKPIKIADSLADYLKKDK